MTQKNNSDSTPPAAPEIPAPGLNVQRRLVLAWLALAWERIWVRLWIVGALLGLFGIVLLTDVLPTFHWAVHTVIVFAAAGGIGYTVWRRLKGFTWPTREEARARLETTSPVAHRPLTTVEDTLVSGATAIQQWMWRLHQARAHEDLDRLRVKAPAPGIASRDRFALRAAVVLGLFVAVIGGWKDMGNRVWRGVLPMFGGDSSRTAIKLWITPPTYTNLSPIYIETPAPEGTTAQTSIDIPAGSKALAIVTGTSRDTSLKFDENVAPLEKLADQTQRGEVELKPAQRLEVRQGPRTLAGWDTKWIADGKPHVSMPAAPGEAARWRLRIDYMIRDDYGVETVTARLMRPTDAMVPPIEIPLTLPANGGNVFVHASVHDLASHIWAGENVQIELTAKDFAGQEGVSEMMEAKLPERVFRHPISKELAKWRKDLFRKPRETVPQALASVTGILQNRSSFGGEPVVALTLSTAKYRLTNETPQEASRSVPELLWHAAVRIEDGNLVAAEQRLVEAEKALREAIERGASAEEIAKRLAELKQAVAEYSKALAENDPDGKKGFTKADKMQADALDQAMNDLKEMSEMGAEDAAKEALANLQEQLQALREGQEKPDEDHPDVQKAQEMMEQMEDLAQQQSNLLDESFNKQRKEEAEENEKSEGDKHGEGMEGGPPSPDEQKSAGGDEESGSSGSGQNAAGKQEALRKKLNEMMDQVEDMTGKTPEAMQDADEAMQDARDSLRSGQWKQGAEGQSKASDKLQQGIEQAREQIMQALLDKGLGGALEKPQPAAVKFSPLGSRDGRRGGEKVTVPTEPDTEGMAQRVRVILDEIRKRAADRTRTESEQDYLRRLQKQF
jgi:uncharacterized protein (TIGR02302 family)